MAQATMTSITALLKEVYEVRLQSSLNNEIETSRRLEKTSKGVIETVGGKYVDFPIRVKRNSGIGSRRENEALPVAGSQGYEEVHVPLGASYGVLRVTGQMLEMAEKNHQAFASSFGEEVDGLKDDTKKDWERQLHGDGTGKLANVTADGVNTITVDSVQYLEIGFVIDIKVIATGADLAANREITDINGLVVTYSGADVAAVAGTHAPYRQGNFDGAVSRELSGFKKIFSATSELHGLTPAAVRKWAAVVNANGAVLRPLSEGLMIQMVDDVRVAGGGKTSAIFTSLGVRRAYFNLLTQQRRFNDVKEYAGGLKGLSFMHGDDIPVVSIVDAPPNMMRFVDESKIKIFRTKDWHFADTDGQMLKWVSGFDAWTGFLKCYAELGTTQRNAQGSLDDLIEG